jgi:hypothetical protein
MNRKYSFFKVGLFVPIVLICLLLSGCATYYQQNEVFNRYFTNGDLASASKALDSEKASSRNKNRALYLLNKGTLSWMQGDYNAATDYFNQADLFIEDQRKNIGSEALALITNPGTKPYKPEDFENVMLNFYKALSYLEMGNMQEALVECRRVNEKLYGLNDKYPKNHKNRYSDDAFAHTLMGLIYDASGDANNAFIAYRNAYKVYEENYLNNFGTPAPMQLKDDLLRTAHQTGLYEEYEFYKSKFGFDYTKTDKSKGSLVFIWLNGLGPVKDEWSINFTALNGRDGMLTLVNEQEGMNFPFFVGDMDSRTRSSFSNLDFVRVAFPKYRERLPIYSNANLELNDSTIYQLEKAQDINAIAFKTLQDRMFRELANSLLRLATKQALESFTRNQDENLGALLSIINAVTEKADTRNWQTLPHSIYYTRVSLDAGENKVNLKTTSPYGSVKNQELNFNIQKGQTTFFSFHNMESN